MSDILQGLNSAQRTAVTSEAEVLQVLAPPGSGKTKTLTSRVAHLVRERHFKPWNIIVCTFTVKAAREMQERIRGFVGEEFERKLRVGTFHRISLLYLRRYGKLIGIADNFGVADTGDSTRIVSRIVKQCKFSLEPKAARERISRSKAQGIDSEQFLQSLQQKKGSGHTGANQAAVEKQEFAEIFSMYQEQLVKCNLLDFDDILLRCVHLLRKHPECVANIEAVLVDEFQDTNGVQYELMSLLAQQKNFITIVGDPDQSIYGWRSADIKNLGRMKSQWRDTLTVNLEENYRSSGAILRAAQKVIEQDETRPPKQLQATHSMGQRPVLRKLPNAKFEAEWIITEIKRLIALSGGMLSLSDFAILLRTAVLSRNIEAAFGKAGLAYRMIGGKKFFDCAEIKLLIDYLRVIDSPAHSEAVERIINEPPRQIGDKTKESLRNEAQSNGQSLWEFVRKVAKGQCRYTTKLSAPAMKGLEQFHDIIASARNKIEKEPTALADLIKLVLNKLSFEKYLKKNYPDDYETKWANVEELIAQATDASTQPEEKPMRDDEGLPPVEGTEAADESPLTAFLANVALSAATDQKAGEDGEQAPQATVSTLHAAKGLEWPVVFIPACYKGSIPHSRAEDNDEERRLLYVGMTRAQVLLSMTFPLRGSSQNESPELSPFLSEPGMSNFFEEHGPSISEKDVRALAITLGREQPTAEALARSKKTLERDEDNYWPLTGEWPPEEVSKLTNGYADDSGPVYGTTRSATWVTASTTMQGEGSGVNPNAFASGFVSAASKFGKLMEEQEQKRLRALDKRAAEQEKITQGQAPKKRKNQIDGQGTISSFFGKKPRVGESLETSIRPTPRPTPRLPTAPMFKPATAPLRDVSNINKPHEAHSISSKPLAALQHRVRAAPLVNRRPLVHSASDPMPKRDNGYVFLSSPPPPQPEEEEDPEPEPTKVEPPAPVTSHLPSFKPASTLHSTSMQGVPSQRRTLGIGKMKPWSARGGKR
jgi:DNA helicase-2/ATP-dependent DNA helicase PcrA